MRWFVKDVCGSGIGAGKHARRSGSRRALKWLLSAAVGASLLACPAAVRAQASNSAVLSLGPILTPYGTPATNASVRVCPVTAIGSPCSTSGVTLYSDYNLTQPIANPTALNTQGILNVFTTIGYYLIQITPVASQPQNIYTFYVFAPPNVSSSLLIQTNGTANHLQTILNHVNTATVSWANPSGGIEEANVIGSGTGNFSNYLSQPTSGQFLFVPATGFTPQDTTATNCSAGSPPGYTVPSSAGTENSMYARAGPCGNNLDFDSHGGEFTFTGALESVGLTQAQVVAVYGTEVLSVGTIGLSQTVAGSCGGSNLALASGQTLVNTSPAFSFPTQQATTATLGVVTVDSLTCSTIAVHSFVNPGGTVNVNVGLAGLWVEYSGTPVTPAATVNFAAPLMWSASLNSVLLPLPYDWAPDTGTANTYVVSNPAYITPGQSYVPSPGTSLWFTPANANTAASTLNFNQFGAVAIDKNVGGSLVALASGDLAATQDAHVEYNGSVWVLQNPATGSASSTVSVNGTAVTSPNFNSTTPAAGTNSINVNWQTSGSSVSAQITGNGVATDFLNGTGTWSAPPGSGTVTASPQFQIPYYSAAGTANTLTGDAGMTTDGSGNATFKSLATTGTAGVGGAANFTEGTAATAAAGHDIIYADSTAHCLELSNNGAAFACIGSGGGSITLTTTGTFNAATYSSGTLNVPIYVKEDTNFNSFVADAGPSGGINPPVGTIGNDLFWGNLAGNAVGQYTAVNTTGTASSGSTTLTIASATGVYQYMNVTGAGIPTGDTVLAISGTTVTLATATTAALSSTPVSFYPGNTNGSIGIGRWALNKMVAGTGIVAIGTGALQNFVTNNSGGEDGNSVAIGPYAGNGQLGQGQVVSGFTCGQLFESDFIGNKVDNDACGATDTQEIGNHIFGFWNVVDSAFIGGELGESVAGVYIEPNRVQAVGDGNFNPVRSGNGTIPTGTYTVSNTNIFGSISGQNLYNTHDNNIVGTNSFDTIGASSPATAIWDIVVGNLVANALSSGSYDTCIGGYDGGSVSTCTSLTSGSNNIVIGNGAFELATTAGNSVAIGIDAAQKQVSNAITAVGDGACQNSTNSNMICFGTWAGNGITSGNYDTIIGSADNSGGSGPSGAASADTCIGTFACNGETSSDNVGIGVTTDKRSQASLGYITAAGYSEFLATSGAAGNEKYDTFLGSNSNCNACTYSVSLGQAAEVATTYSTTATATSGSTSLTVASASNMVVGQYIAGAGIPAQDTITNISGTTITIATATTAALSSTAVYFTTPVAHAVQIDGGTNIRSNTVQYQSWNFLDSSGDVHDNLQYTAVGTAIASAATIAPVSGITHVTGTSTISTITVPTVAVNGGSYTGCITLVADGAWATATGGNISAAFTATAGSSYRFCYDGTTWNVPGLGTGGGGGTATIVASAEVVAFSATPTFSTSYNTSRIVLTGNITSFTLGAGSDGQSKTLCFKQGTGPYTVTAPANVHGFFAIGTTSGDWNCQSFNYDATDSIWLATSTGVINQ